MIIGICGEIGSGKTTICNILRKYRDFIYIDVDKISHMIITKGQKAYNEIIDYFGKDILNQDDSIDRNKLGNIVFADSSKLEVLNNITHKYIYSNVIFALNKLRFENMFVEELNVIIDEALLYEIRLDSLVDKVWYVEADRDIRIKRIMERNNLTKNEALLRVDSQKISIHKCKADRIIMNNGSLKEIEDEIAVLVKDI